MDFSSYFAQIAVGVLGLTPLVPWRAVGRGYFVMMLAIALPLLAIAGWYRASGGEAGGAVLVLFGACGLLGLASLTCFLGGKGAPGWHLVRASALLGWIGIAADGVRAAGLASGPAAEPALLAANFVAGALLLGASLSAMLLGHWYLVVKDLPVEPLRALTLVFFAALGARLAATAAAFVLDPAGGSAVVDRSFLFVLVYALFSLGTPIGMSWMVWGTVRIRSTQAATGILYGVVAFILMGEAAGRFVLVRTGFPL